jgi:CheY-like chemotaxis protein
LAFTFLAYSLLIMRDAMKTVLVVEGDDTLRGALQMVLQWEGYRVASAGNGREALDLLYRGDRPAVVLLDLMLPDLDGWQVRRAMQDDPRLADIPVVVVSALDAGRCPDAAGHIQKPFQPQELLEVIRHQTA